MPQAFTPLVRRPGEHEIVATQVDDVVEIRATINGRIVERTMTFADLETLLLFLAGVDSRWRVTWTSVDIPD